jgi:hypothetical protein
MEEIKDEIKFEEKSTLAHDMIKQLQLQKDQVKNGFGDFENSESPNSAGASRRRSRFSAR